MPARRTILEWTTLLELEPSQRYIFVEGEANQRILRAFFESFAAPHVAVLKASDVEIPPRLIHATPFSSGNKARLLSFASVIENGPIDNLRCIVDQDFASVVPVANLPRLAWGTDFANFWIYFADFATIHHLVGAVYGHDFTVADFNAVTDATQFVFAARIDRYERYPGAHTVDLYPSLNVTRGKLVFDGENLIRRFALANGFAREIEGMRARINGWRANFHGDPRSFMNFHDFMALLYGGLKRKRLLPSGVDEREFGRAFAATVGIERLRAVPLVQRLLAWVGR